MRGLFLAVLGIALFTCGRADAQIRMTLDQAVHQIAAQVKDILKENVLIKGKKINIGSFDPDGAKARKSNFSVGIQQKLSETLKDFRDENSDVTLTGNYVFTSGKGDNSPIEIVRLVVSIKELGKLIQELSDVEINETNTMYEVLGGTGAPPPNAPLKERNDELKRDIANPAFELVDGHLVAAKKQPKLCMGILKKKSFNGATSVVVPENVNGLAFAKVDVGEYYEIELVNKDSIDVAVKIDVDGLDVINTFVSDVGPDGKKVNFRGFIIRKGGSLTVKGWLHTTDTKKSDNVFTFVVNQLGQGVATQLNTRGTVGVITAQFREICPPGGTMSRSVGGETGKGEPLDQKFKAESVQISEDVLSTVSIRYNRPQ